MKRLNFLIVLALLGVASFFWQCGSDPAPTKNPQDEQLEKLSKTWKVNSANAVLFSSTGTQQPVSGYDNFEITISGTPGQSTFNFNTSGRPPGIVGPWPATGTFTFGSDFATVFTRNDGLVITYSVTDTQLQMTFSYTGAGFTGRVNEVEGNWTFNLGL